MFFVFFLRKSHRREIDEQIEKEEEEEEEKTQKSRNNHKKKRKRIKLKKGREKREKGFPVVSIGSFVRSFQFSFIHVRQFVIMELQRHQQLFDVDV